MGFVIPLGKIFCLYFFKRKCGNRYVKYETNSIEIKKKSEKKAAVCQYIERLRVTIQNSIKNSL